MSLLHVLRSPDRWSSLETCSATRAKSMAPKSRASHRTATKKTKQALAHPCLEAQSSVCCGEAGGTWRTTAMTDGILLPGWDCACGGFNGSGKEELQTCRFCGISKPSDLDLSFRRLKKTYDQTNVNLTSVQERCTELVLENRDLRSTARKAIALLERWYATNAHMGQTLHSETEDLLKNTRGTK
jgi:hypothetical protein